MKRWIKRAGWIAAGIALLAATQSVWRYRYEVVMPRNGAQPLLVRVDRLVGTAVYTQIEYTYHVGVWE